MDSEFMNQISELLALRGVHVLRFEFPYMAQRRQDGRKRPPNPQKQLLTCWREIYQAVRSYTSPELPLFIGGKSMGGRMASMVADELQVTGLVCLGYPFYAPGKPEKPRIAHLQPLLTPTLIVQGDRDALGARPFVESCELSKRIRLQWLPEGDHDFKPRKSSGLTQYDLLLAAAEGVANFLRETVSIAGE
ncbi:MAG: alpha/beta hydrolase [Hahellaceae bacterium]|nr:alpha/beta hydrolase [Hahellaceae bacterium]